MRILLTGAKGQLGQSITNRWKNNLQIELLATDIEELDICDPIALQQEFSKFKPDFCLNGAAYTAVDKAEIEQEKAMAINAQAVKNLCIACKEHNTTLLHISSDYVYDSWPVKLLTESAPTRPKSIYGQSKLLGDQLIINQLVKYYIFRTSWLYSEYGNNFVKTILRLSQSRPEIQVVDDQFGSPTYAGDLAEALKYLVLAQKAHHVPPFGVYNFSNDGFTNWFDFACNILEFAGKSGFPLKRISTKSFGSPAPRPYNSKMSKKKFLQHFNFPLKDWKVSLRECIDSLT
ncbi:MAG TPA: dTDP-4-dehydrorhamnose reductase [Saprospiraceae bacterium]|nr:dTDP-4-dehydrorhamnose reductase [Saprospiraceae bacterium]